MPAKKSLPTTRKTRLQSYLKKVADKFHTKHTTASAWLQSRSLDVGNLKHHSQQLVAAASLAGSVLVNQPVDAVVQQQLKAIEQKETDATLASLTQEEKDAVFEKMSTFAAGAPGQLSEEDELYLEQQLTDILGFEVTAELEGNRLNHTVGIMGGEQHLFRFPGDTLDQHTAYQEAGIAPNRGAFGWFTENGVLTDTAIEREKYYFAVQTLYLPNWNTDYPTLKPWYAFRKMVVINPYEKIAVVGVVGDAGPAQWVQKQFGGSPEVIREGKIWSSESRGRVLLFFVDDPQDEIALGVRSLDDALHLAQGSTE